MGIDWLCFRINIQKIHYQHLKIAAIKRSQCIVTDETGAEISRHDYHAFGEEIYAGVANRTTTNKYSSFDDISKQFTGYERDVESGLDFAQARYYNSRHGRFTSVDPLTASANVKNPQTFNRYSYVLNSPYKFVDPLGLISRNAGSPTGTCYQCVDGSAFRGTDTSLDQLTTQSQQRAEPPPPPPPPDNDGATQASSITPTVKVDSTFAGIVEPFGIGETTINDDLLSQLQAVAESAEQNQLAYMINTDEAVRQLTAAWHYTDQNSFDFVDDLITNIDNIPPLFVDGGGQIITHGLSISGGLDVGPGFITGTNSGSVSYGAGSGGAAANAANNQIAEVYRLRNVNTADNFARSVTNTIGTVRYPNGAWTEANIKVDSIRILHQKAVEKGIDAARARYIRN